MDEVYDAYGRLDDDPVRIAKCHWMFEKTHPFSDGNGRVGRLVMFKECLRLDTVPPLVRDEHHNRYTHALDLFPEQPGWLVDLLLSERDAYRVQFIDNLAKGGVAYTYNDTWNETEHRTDLADAAEFKRRVNEAARQSGHDDDADLFGMYGTPNAQAT